MPRATHRDRRRDYRAAQRLLAIAGSFMHTSALRAFLEAEQRA
jgi:hypothetical protein